MKFKNIFEEEIKDRYILPKDEIYKEIHEILYENSKNILKLNEKGRGQRKAIPFQN